MNGRTGVGGTRHCPGPRARKNDREPTRGSHRGWRPKAVETGWMAAAETRMPIATKTLAEREASMDGQFSTTLPHARLGACWAMA
jgi:hypothetical protein